MTRIAAVYIPKGGVGKTFLTAHLASGLAEAGRRVLAVDVDPHQAQLVLSFGDLERRGDTYRFFVGSEPLHDIVQTSDRFPNVHIVTGTPATSAAISTHLSKGTNPYWVKILERRVKPITDQYDYILFDCGPSITDVMQATLHVCTELWLPYKIDWKTMDSYLLLTDEVLAPMDKQPESFITHVIPNFFTMGALRKPKTDEAAPGDHNGWWQRARSNEALSIISELNDLFGHRVTPPVRLVEAKTLEADSIGKTLWEVAPTAPITDDLARVVEAILAREEAPAHV